jgi:hypothetical protein
MHPPIIDEEGGSSMKTEDLYVIEHPSFRSIIDQIKHIIEEKSSDEIEHTREYVPVLQRADLTEREANGVRLVRFEGLREVVPDWRKSFDPLFRSHSGRATRTHRTGQPGTGRCDRRREEGVAEHRTVCRPSEFGPSTSPVPAAAKDQLLSRCLGLNLR